MEQNELNALMQLAVKANAVTLSEQQKEDTLSAFSSDVQTPLSHWLSKQMVPEVGQAWQNIYAGQWGSAVDTLTQLDLSKAGEGWLALARVAIRHGYFRKAKEYLKHAIVSYRAQNNEHNLIKAHGMLGELLLRQGFVKKSLHHMQLAYSLSPPGDLGRQLQYSFLAMPLARLGQIHLAQEHYMRALVMADNAGNHQSLLHAWIRLAALALYGKDDALIQARELMDYYRIEPSGAVKGYWLLLLLWDGWQQGHYEAALQQQALEILASLLPYEAACVKAISPIESDQPESDFVRINALDMIEQHRLPEVVDYFLLDELPFKDRVSIPPIQSSDQFKDCLKSFFI